MRPSNSNLLTRLVKIFFLAFGFNLVWENLHSYFYIHYQHQPITELILIRASFVDALIIFLLATVFLNIKFCAKKPWIFLISGIVIAIILERFALATGRWEYNHLMTILPLINTGLTPTIQLGLISYLIIKLTNPSNA